MLVLSVAALLATAGMATASGPADVLSEEESDDAFEHDEMPSEDEEELHDNGDGLDAIENGDEHDDDREMTLDGVLASDLEVLRCVDENTVLVKKTEILTMPLSEVVGHDDGLNAHENHENNDFDHENEEALLESNEEDSHTASDVEVVRCVDEDTILVRTTALVPKTVLQEETVLETMELDELVSDEEEDAFAEEEGLIGEEEERGFEDEEGLIGQEDELGFEDDELVSDEEEDAFAEEEGLIGEEEERGFEDEEGILGEEDESDPFLELEAFDDPFLDLDFGEEDAFESDEDEGVLGEEDERESEDEHENGHEGLLVIVNQPTIPIGS